MSKYKVNGIDLDLIAEPKTIGAYDAISTTPIDKFINMNDYANYSNNYYYNDSIISGYKVDGTEISLMKKGTKPRLTLRYSFTSTGTYWLTRNEGYITVWNSTGSVLSYIWVTPTPDTGSYAPHILIVMLIGGGRTGYSGTGTVGGTGGGGGGKLIGYIRIPTTNVYSEGTKIIVGGTSGSSSATVNSKVLQANGTSSNVGGGVSYPTPDTEIGVFKAANGGNGGAGGGGGSAGLPVVLSLEPENFSYTMPLGGGGSAGYGGGGGGSQGIGGAGGGSGKSGSAGSAPGGGGGGGAWVWFDGKPGGAGARGEVRLYY